MPIAFPQEIVKEIYFYCDGGLSITTEDKKDGMLEYFIENFETISYDDGYLRIFMPKVSGQLVTFHPLGTSRFTYKRPLAKDFQVASDGIIVIEEQS
jgi:hypothetical protein